MQVFNTFAGFTKCAFIELGIGFGVLWLIIGLVLCWNFYRIFKAKNTTSSASPILYFNLAVYLITLSIYLTEVSSDYQIFVSNNEQFLFICLGLILIGVYYYARHTKNRLPIKFELVSSLIIGLLFVAWGLLTFYGSYQAYNSPECALERYRKEYHITY